MLLELKNVTGTNRKFNLDNISMIIEEGYITALQGKNEAGKSTLFSYILENKNKYTGEIIFEGVDIKRIGKKKFNKISYIADDNELFMGYTIKQNATIMELVYDKWDKDVFQNKIYDFGLSEGTRYFKLSRGEKIKFQLAVAMAHNTSLYLIDEATAGMDPVFRREFFGILKDIIKEEKAGVLLITHIESEIKQHVDYVYNIENGKLMV